MVFQFGLPPNRIDVLNQLSGGVDFEAAWGKKTSTDFGGVVVSFIGIDELIAKCTRRSWPRR